jgi:hypothetical protein
VFEREEAVRRLSGAYGPEAAAEIEAILPA